MYDTLLIQRAHYWKRPGYQPNIEQLMQLAEETQTILEINANPKRLI